jgi:GT2 family glycosyltransferase
MNQQFVSIIIVTKNRLEDLKRTLERTVEKSFLGYDYYEIVVVDSSKNEVAKHVRDTAKKVGNSSEIPITYVHKDVNMPGARNVGIRYAKGEIILFIDDDLILHRMSLSRIINDFEQYKNAGVIGGRVVEDPSRKSLLGTYGKPGVKINPFGLITTNLIGGDKIVEVMGVRGCCMAFKKPELLGIGGFDENYGGTSNSEEGDVQARMRKKGYKIIYDPDIISFHLFSKAARPKNPTSVIVSNYENFTYFWFKNYLFSKISYTVSGGIFIVCLLLKAILTSLAQKDSFIMLYAIKGISDGISKYKNLRLLSTVSS